MRGNRSETMRKDFFESQHRSRIGMFFEIFPKFVRFYICGMSGTFGTPALIPHQPVTVEMQTLDENGKAINVQINPQPMVTAETLQTFNKTLLNDLHQPEKSRIIRPVDNVKPKSIGGKILDALKAFGHAVRSLFYGSKNAVHTRLNELGKLSTDIKNANIPVEEHKKIQAQTNANIEEIKHFLSSAKEEHKPLLNDCLDFYENFSKKLRFDKFQKRNNRKYEPSPTDPGKKSHIQALANDWKQTIEKLTEFKDGKRVPKTTLSKDNIESLKDAFEELSKAWIPFGKQQSFKNVMSQEGYDKYTELQENIIKAYAKQQAEEMLNFIRGNFEGIVEGSMGKDFALKQLNELQKIEAKTTNSASVDLRQQLQLLKILLMLQTSPDKDKALETLLSDKKMLLPKEEDCIFFIQHLDTLKKISLNAPLVDKIEKIKSDLPGYLSACYEQNIVNAWEYEENVRREIQLRKTMRNERLLTAAKLYASDTQPSGVFNMNIERLRQNLETDREIFEKTTASLTAAEDTRRFEMPESDVRNKIGQFLEIRNLFELKDTTPLENLSKNSDKDISTAAKNALEKLKTLQ